jgi:hypothetical protein
MIQEFFIAAFKAGLPVGVAAYLLVWWALRNGHVGEADTVRDIEKEVKRLAKDKEARKNGDPVHRKWLAMGGGFYGVVAMITLLTVEVGEVLDFLADFEGIGPFIDSLSIGWFIELFIETLRNSFIAIAWPVYWLGDIRSDYIWIWFIAAYAGYWLGSSLATRHFRERKENSG